MSKLGRRSKRARPQCEYNEAAYLKQFKPEPLPINPTTLLLRALKKADPDTVKKCLSGAGEDGSKMPKADSNYIDRSGGWSTVHYALPFTDTPNTDTPNNAKNMQLLLNYGAKPDCYDDYGMTALQWAAARGSKYCLKVLCGVYKAYAELHPSIFIKDTTKPEPTSEVPKPEKPEEERKEEQEEEREEQGEEQGEELPETLDLKPKAEDQEEKKTTEEENMVQRDVLDMKRFRENNEDGLKSGLLSGGGVLNINHIEANVEAKNALHFAVLYGQTVSVQLLLQHGADVESRTRELWTPLHFAAHFGFAKCVKALLEAGASVYPENDTGKTALKMAVLGSRLAKQNKNNDFKDENDFPSGVDTDKPNSHQECIELLQAAEKKEAPAQPAHVALPQPKEHFYLWEAEKIMDMRQKTVRNRDNRTKGASMCTEYLVKWRNYAEIDSTWEPAENLQNCPVLLRKFNEKLELKNARAARKGYKPATLEQLLPKERITEVQRLSKFAQFVKEYRLKLKDGNLDNPEMSCRDRELTKHIRTQIIQILKGEHKRDCFEIGMITDESNPACRFAGTTVHTGRSYGLYATRHIEVDTVLGEYVGMVNRYDDCQRNADLETELNQTTYFDLIESQKWGNGKSKCAIGDTLVIDPSDCRNELVYMNDYRSEDKDVNRKQNVAYHEVLVNGWPHIFAITKREVPQAAELLTNYGQAWWENFRIIIRRQNHLAELKKKWTLEVEQTKIDNEKLKAEVAEVKEEMQSVLAENARLKKEAEKLHKKIAELTPRELK